MTNIITSLFLACAIMVATCLCGLLFYAHDILLEMKDIAYELQAIRRMR